MSVWSSLSVFGLRRFVLSARQAHIRCRVTVIGQPTLCLNLCLESPAEPQPHLNKGEKGAGAPAAALANTTAILTRPNQARAAFTCCDVSLVWGFIVHCAYSVPAIHISRVHACHTHITSAHITSACLPYTYHECTYHECMPAIHISRVRACHTHITSACLPYTYHECVPAIHISCK